MEYTLSSRLKHAWNAFTSRDPTYTFNRTYGHGDYRRPDRVRLTRGNEKSIITPVFNRMALDVAAINIRHTRLDKDGRYIEDMDSGLNECLSVETNIDQTPRAFIKDVVMSMFDEGCVAIVPVDTTEDIRITNSFDIHSMRVGKIVEWFPTEVKVNVYNDRTGKKEDIILPKKSVGIVENPFYEVMNEPSSTLQRLIRKLNLLDAVDEQCGSGKLDLIIQLPYIVKSEGRRRQAEERRQAIEEQLKGPFGIAYTDGTEKVIQLNRPVENNLLKTIEYLTSMLYSQLNITQGVLDGTADEKTMLNYNNRNTEVIISAIVDEMKRKFITKTARSQRQSISFFRDPFRLVPVTEIAEIADKFTRNEIATSNEIRQVIGWKPSSDPNADVLRNKNLNPTDNGGPVKAANKPNEQSNMKEEEQDE